MHIISSDVFKYEARNQKEFDKFFEITLKLIHDPEVQKEVQDVDFLLKEIKDPQKLIETKKRISEMKNHPISDIDSLGIFLAVPNKTLEQLCKLNKYYETIAYLVNKPIDFSDIQRLFSKTILPKAQPRLTINLPTPIHYFQQNFVSLNMLEKNYEQTKQIRKIESGRLYSAISEKDANC
jgi:hypothetical protein